MIPLIATIVSVYCAARLFHLGNEVCRRNHLTMTDEKGGASWPNYDISYLIFYGATVAVVFLCVGVWVKEDEIARALRQPEAIPADEQKPFRDFD